MASPVVTCDQLRELEAPPSTGLRRILQHALCALPLLAGGVLLLQYFLVPNHGLNTATNVYPIFLAVFLIPLTATFAASFFSKRWYAWLTQKAPLYTAVFLLLTAYDYLTLKTGRLMLPYFPWPDRVLLAIWEDRALLLDCIRNSLILLFAGYFAGAAAGLLSGIAAGWCKPVHYWIAPLIKILGPIPSTTWLPIILIVASSLFRGSVFLIALGVWYPVTVTSLTGVANVRKSYFEAARTLGASKRRLIFQVAIPAAMPNILQGLTQGMSVACTALMVAEMMGVESGLGWYINWQRGWAEFAKMYAAVIVICLTFTCVNFVLGRIRKRALRWQEGTIQ